MARQVQPDRQLPQLESHEVCRLLADLPECALHEIPVPYTEHRNDHGAGDECEWVPCDAMWNEVGRVHQFGANVDYNTLFAERATRQPGG